MLRFFPFRRIHNIVGLVTGILFLFWTASGLFFTLYPIEQIRGETLRAPINHGQMALGRVVVTASEAAASLESHEPVKAVDFGMFFGDPVWKIDVGGKIHMINAVTGNPRSPVSAEDAERIAREGIKTSAGTPGTPRLLRENPPREYGGPLPAYIVDYEPGSVRIYIDAQTGRLVTVRSGLWRWFDVLWRFHILDITGADRFDSWWLKLAAFFALVMSISGGILVAQRVMRGTIFR